VQEHWSDAQGLFQIPLALLNHPLVLVHLEHIDGAQPAALGLPPTVRNLGLAPGTEHGARDLVAGCTVEFVH